MIDIHGGTVHVGGHGEAMRQDIGMGGSRRVGIVSLAWTGSVGRSSMTRVGGEHLGMGNLVLSAMRPRGRGVSGAFQCQARPQRGKDAGPEAARSLVGCRSSLRFSRGMVPEAGSVSGSR